METQIKLINKKTVAKETKMFQFEKPQELNYEPGQYAFFTLDELKHEDERGDRRHFTLSSIPADDNIAFTTRMRESSGYKKTLDEHTMGTEVHFRGPQGDFTLREGDENKQHVFLAGGIGITPFYSILRHINQNKLPHSITLLYGNSLPEEITFQQELDEIAQKNETISVVHTISKPEKSEITWEGHTGRIDAELIRSYVQDVDNAIYWSTGPPAMVDAMEKILKEELKIDDDQVRLEKFSGY